MASGPIRSCSGCRTRHPQSTLIRVVRRPDGEVTIDPGRRGSVPGRGAYVCCRRSCVEQAFDSGRLGRALRHEGGLGERLRNELLDRIEAGNHGPE